MWVLLLGLGVLVVGLAVALVVAGVVLVLRRDVTGRRAAEAALRELATVDPLTGLLNRRGVLERGAELVALAERFDRRVSLFFADLDGLKGINDAFGHAAGDEALAGAARALRATFRSSDVVARWSGDEFVALTAVEREADGEEILARLAAATREVNAGAGLPFAISLSVGAISASGTGESIPDLVGRADRAMYEQKSRRRNASVLPS
jgi:diguanylate cyclase (GGDEF)-like protein